MTASVLDNPYLTDGDKERFKRKYEGTAKEEQALHGGFAAATGLVYSEFTRDTHVIEHADAVDRLEDTGGDRWRIYGYDAGWRDPRVLLEIGRTDYGQLVVLDEFHASGSHVEDAIEWLKRAEKPKGRIFAEHEPADIKKFRKAGWPAVKAEKSIDAGISEVRKRLQSDGAGPIDDTPTDPRASPTWGGDDVLAFSFDPSDPTPSRSDDDEDSDDVDAERAEGRVGLLVSDRCTHLIREFLGYKEDHVGGSSATDHCLDSLRYACMGVAEQGGSHRSGRGGSDRSGVTFL